MFLSILLFLKTPSLIKPTFSSRLSEGLLSILHFASMIDNSKKWNIVYVSKWSVDRLIAEELENDIIQTGINKDANDTTIWQWNFKNIEKDTFSWESIYSKDCGKTWKYATKVEAKREM